MGNMRSMAIQLFLELWEEGKSGRDHCCTYSSWTTCLRFGVRPIMLGVGEGKGGDTRVLLERL